MVDAEDLKSFAFGRAGSSPAGGTTKFARCNEAATKDNRFPKTPTEFLDRGRDRRNSLLVAPRVARIGNDLLKRQVDNVHGDVLGKPAKRNGVSPPFRFRRVVSGLQAFVLLGQASKRNETGIFRGVTGKPSRLAPPNTVKNRRDPFSFNGLRVSQN